MRMNLSAPSLAGKTDKEKLDITANTLCRLINELNVVLMKLDANNFGNFEAELQNSETIKNIKAG